MAKLRVGVVADADSVGVKGILISRLASSTIECVDLGAHDEDDCWWGECLAKRVADALRCGEVDCVVGLTLTGNSLQIYANKYPFVTAIPCISEIEGVEAINSIPANAVDIDSRLDLRQIESIARAFLVAVSAKDDLPSRGA